MEDGDGDGDGEERDGKGVKNRNMNNEDPNSDDDNEDEDDNDGKDDNEDEGDDDEGPGKTPAVLANVNWATTVCKYQQLFITMHNQNTHLFTDHRVPPSVIAEDIQVPQLKDLIHKFLQQQLDLQPSELAEPLDLDGNISVYTSAVAVYHAPSYICGINGMAGEHIHATL